jgi:D-3-phosphoglycerate dehydrogenase
LRLIVKHGIGVDNIDIPAATRRNIIVMNAPQVNPLAVADLSMTLLLSFARRIIEAHQNVLSGKWNQFLGVGVNGKTRGVIGLGRFGLAVVDRAKALHEGHRP